MTYSFVEVRSVSSLVDDTSTDTEVTEPLRFLAIGIPFKSVALEKRNHNIENLFFLDGLAEQLVQTLAVVSTTKVHVVSTVGLSNKSHLSKPWAGTTVRATGHTHDDAFPTQANFFESRLELGDEDGQVAFGFSHCETAGGEGDTGGRRETKTRERGVVEFVLGHQVLDHREIFVLDVGQNQVLVTSQAELTLLELGQLTKTGAHGEFSSVLDTTVLNEEGEVVQARFILLPAKGIDVRHKLERTRLLEPHSIGKESLDLLLEARDSHVVDGIL